MAKRLKTLPAESAIDWEGLELTAADRKALLRVNPSEWVAEVPEIRAFFERFGSRLPVDLEASLSSLERDLARVTV